jgi:hypothetical protein
MDGGLVGGVALGEAGVVDGGIGGGEGKLNAGFCLLGLVDEAGVDGGGGREAGEGGVGVFGFLPTGGGLFGDALEVGALEALGEVAPVAGIGGWEGAGEVVGAGGDGVGTLLQEEVAGTEDDGEGGGGAGLDYEEEAGALFPGGEDQGVAGGGGHFVEGMGDDDEVKV